MIAGGLKMEYNLNICFQRKTVSSVLKMNEDLNSFKKKTMSFLLLTLVYILEK